MSRKFILLSFAMLLSSLNAFSSTYCHSDKEIVRVLDVDTDRYEYATNASSQFSRRGMDLEGEYATTLTLRAKVMEKETHYITSIVSRNVKRGVRCVGRDTIYNSGTGNEVMQDLFENPLSKEERARRIESGIKGAGPVVAKALVWHFERATTPFSWEDFSEIIRSAEETQKNKGSSLRFVTSILETYKNDNVKGLGFENQAESGSCNQWEAICRRVRSQETEVREEERFVREIRRTINVELAGVPLLNGETERFTASYNNATNDIEITQSTTYGNYVVADKDYSRRTGEYYIALEGKRKNVSSQNDLSVMVSNQNNEIVLTVQNPSFTRNFDIGQRVIYVQALHLKRFGRIERVGLRKSFNLNENSSRTVIRTGIMLPAAEKIIKGFWRKREVIKTQKYKLEVASQYVDSFFYNSNITSTKQTQTVENKL